MLTAPFLCGRVLSWEHNRKNNQCSEEQEGKTHSMQFSLNVLRPSRLMWLEKPTEDEDQRWFFSHALARLAGFRVVLCVLFKCKIEVLMRGQRKR